MSTPPAPSSGNEKSNDPEATVIQPHGPGLDPTLRSPAPVSKRSVVDADGDGEADLPQNRSMPHQDLARDSLLALAPREVLDNRPTPVLGGVYLTAKLGQGGMGAVYYGLHSRLSKEVAVKVLPQNLAEQDPDLMKRFFREAQIATRVDSPHIVRVYDVNRDDASGLCFTVMEYVHGLSAHGLMQPEKGKPPARVDEREALEVVLAATRGLAAAHEEGVIHRDIKPHNILIPFAKNSAKPNLAGAKLADLGLARMESSDQNLTATQSAMGTPGYLAPEQAQDAKNAGKPADVYGMGATLYALLSGQAPFTGSSAAMVLIDTIQKPHVPIRNLRPDVSEVTAELLDRCLAKNPAERYSDGAVLCEALGACRDWLGSAVRGPARPNPAPGMHAPQHASHASRQSSAARVEVSPLPSPGVAATPIPRRSAVSVPPPAP
ncbi:MAG: serine/threonine protein kinase [Planctomycetota bacterium]|nr:serine/threonine protein kinase [Planctomycetota bacterium]